MRKIYAGIGSRQTPADILVRMFRISSVLSEHGFILRTGHAPGADQAFEAGAKGKMESFLPWNGFEGAQDGREGFIDATRLPTYKEAMHIASQFHPAWERCNNAARRFHTRNVYQVLGADLKSPVEFIVCWTKGGQGGGGTGQALRLAKHLGIPIFDLAKNSLDELKAFLNRTYS